MKNTFTINIIFLTSIFLYCSCSTNDSEIIIKSAFYINYQNDTINSIDTICLKVAQVKNGIDYIYTDNPDSDTVYAFSFYVYKDTDSIINLFNHDCPLVETKNYKINGETYKIKKYYFDKENHYDEESSFFYNEKYGLLVLFNDGWSILWTTIYYDKISNQLVDSILIDTAGFYKLPPPPPPKSMKIITN